jgi:hypothetical protein
MGLRQVLPVQTKSRLILWGADMVGEAKTLGFRFGQVNATAPAICLIGEEGCNPVGWGEDFPFRPMGKIYQNIVETIGRTPLVKLNHITEGLEATVALKCEFFNPLGSVKDRIGMAMIEAAEAAGLVNRDTVIIEPTSGLCCQRVQTDFNDAGDDVAGTPDIVGDVGGAVGVDAGCGGNEGGDC